MEANGGALYGMDGLGPRQLPSDFVMQPTEQWGFVANGRESRMPGRGTVGGTERSPFPSQPSYPPQSFMNSAAASSHARNHTNPARLSQQQIYANGSSNYLSAQPMPAPARTDHVMQPGSGIEDFFATPRPDQPQMLHTMQHPEGKPRQASYSNKPSNWAPQHGTRHVGMVSHGVPAAYDPIYSERIGSLRPTRRQEYDMPRTMIHPQQQMTAPSRPRAVPGNPCDYPPMAGIQQRAAYGREDNVMMHTRTERVPHGYLSVEAELFKKYISTHFHELDESRAFCTAAYETHKDSEAYECMEGIRKLIQCIKECANSRRPCLSPADLPDVFARLQKRMVGLIRSAKQIKARLESPQSINSTANAPLEEQEDAPHLPESASRIPLHQRISHAAHQRMPPPVSTSKSHPKERKPHAGNPGNHEEVIVIDGADEAERRKEQPQRQRGPNVHNAYQLQPWLGNIPPPQPGSKFQPPSQSPAHHDMRRKRELVSPEDGGMTGITPSSRSRDIRRKLNPAAHTMPDRMRKTEIPDLQKASDSPVVRADMTPTTECAGSNDDNASVEGDIPRSTEIDSLLTQIIGQENPDGDPDEVLCKLRFDEDDAAIYDRRFLEMLASAEPSPHSPSRIRESIPQMAFKPSNPASAHTLSDEHEPMKTSLPETNEMDADHKSLYAAIQEECTSLEKELDMQQPLCITVDHGNEGVAVEYGGFQNKDGDINAGQCIKLIFGRAYPSAAPIISFTQLPDDKRTAFIRKHFLKKITDMKLIYLTDILRLWLTDISVDNVT